jgi:putative FmdB family regulatory protein
MSNYAFFCLDCNQEFTQHLLMSEYEKEEERTCPRCGGHRVTQRVEAFSAVTSKKS